MRQMERDMAMEGPAPHIINLGKLVEEHENKIRNTLNEIYFGKSRDIVNGLRFVKLKISYSTFIRSIEPLKDESQKRALAAELNKRLSEKPS